MFSDEIAVACGGHEAIGGGDDSADDSMDKLDSQQGACDRERAAYEKAGAQRRQGHCRWQCAWSADTRHEFDPSTHGKAECGGARWQSQLWRESRGSLGLPCPPDLTIDSKVHPLQHMVTTQVQSAYSLGTFHPHGGLGKKSVLFPKGSAGHVRRALWIESTGQAGTSWALQTS